MMLLDWLSLVSLPWKIIFSDPVLNDGGGKKDYTCERWFLLSASWAVTSRHLGILLTTSLESVLAACAEILLQGSYSVTQQFCLSEISPK